MHLYRAWRNQRSTRRQLSRTGARTPLVLLTNSTDSLALCSPLSHGRLPFSYALPGALPSSTRRASPLTAKIWRDKRCATLPRCLTRLPPRRAAVQPHCPPPGLSWRSVDCTPPPMTARYRTPSPVSAWHLAHHHTHKQCRSGPFHLRRAATGVSRRSSPPPSRLGAQPLAVKWRRACV